MIVELANDERVQIPLSDFEMQAKIFGDATVVEALNMDRKILPGSGIMPGLDDVVRALQDGDVFGDGDLKGDGQWVFYAESGEMVIVRSGNVGNNPRLAQMITVSVVEPETGTITLQYHLSPQLPDDRRLGTHTTRLQKVVRQTDGKLFDLVVGQEIEVNELPKEVMPPIELAESDLGNYLIQMSRYVLNLIRGNRMININQIDHDSWVPNVSDKERAEFLSFAMEIPYLVMDGAVDKLTIDEFRNRMMASFCINPKLFLNLSNYFHFSAIFPYFSKHELRYRFYEDVDDVPEDTDEFKKFMVNMMDPDYDERFSVLGNLASVFKIGIGEWSREEI
jgi:hypothetical protein